MKKLNRVLMVTRFFLALAATIVVTVTTEAKGAWSDNFDSYANGSTIIGQGAWAGWELAESGVNDSVVTDAQASSGAHSLMMGGTPYVDLIPQFEGVTSGEWTVEAMTYVPDDSNDGVTDIGFLSRHVGFQDADSTQWFGAFRLHMANDFAGGHGGGFLPIVRDEWVPMQAVFNIDDREYEIFYDGEFAASGSWDGDHALVGLDVWSEDNASTMYYDDFRVAPVGPDLLGDFDGSGMRDPADYDLLAMGVINGDAAFDLDGDLDVDAEDRRVWVEDLSNTHFGDSNWDGEFNSTDFVAVFTPARYETDSPAGWAEGDWNGDTLFNSSDFVIAFSGGGYEAGPRPGGLMVVPEPNVCMLLLAGLCGVLLSRGRKS